MGLGGISIWQLLIILVIVVPKPEDKRLPGEEPQNSEVIQGEAQRSEEKH